MPPVLHGLTQSLVSVIPLLDRLYTLRERGPPHPRSVDHSMICSPSPEPISIVFAYFNKNRILLNDVILQVAFYTYGQCTLEIFPYQNLEPSGFLFTLEDFHHGCQQKTAIYLFPRPRELPTRGLSGFIPISGHLLPFRVTLKQIPEPGSLHP